MIRYKFLITTALLLPGVLWAAQSGPAPSQTLVPQQKPDLVCSFVTKATGMYFRVTNKASLGVGLGAKNFGVSYRFDVVKPAPTTTQGFWLVKSLNPGASWEAKVHTLPLAQGTNIVFTGEADSTKNVSERNEQNNTCIHHHPGQLRLK